MRPDWDSYFMKIAYAVSERSTCDRAFVGCVLVLEKRILTTGFNGSPAGQDHCDEAGHLMVDGHCVRTIHAETNAIIQAALHGVSTRGCTCYVTHFPCINCTKALISAIPIPDPTLKHARAILQGDVPSPLNPPPGCVFHPRCPIAVERCGVDEPELRDIGGGEHEHWVACHLVDG